MALDQLGILHLLDVLYRDRRNPSSARPSSWRLVCGLVALDILTLVQEHVWLVRVSKELVLIACASNIYYKSHYICIVYTACTNLSITIVRLLESLLSDLWMRIQ